jgi:4-hydroxy-3-polyprenylbenzoate decarboxylase
MRYRHGVKDLGIPAEAASLKQKLKRAGIEDVLDVWQLTIPGVLVIQLRQRFPGHAMKAALILAGEYMGRYIVVVDEDIDPRSPDEVLWAIGTRSDPATSISIVNGCQSSVLDPRITPERKRAQDFTSSQAIINACKPFHWIKEFPATNVASPELRAATREKWSELFGG